LSTFDPTVADRALHWQRKHPKRGPTRILEDMKQDDMLTDLRLPKPRTLAEFFRSACPELLQKRQPRPAPPHRAEQIHELWQVDGKENIRLEKGTIATVLDVREPAACAFLVNRAHEVQTEKGWRKLTLRENQDDLRLAFTEFGLPVGIQTDREVVYGRPPEEAFPSLFTLWLVGLGVEHHFTRPGQPTDQPHVERGHRTLFDWMEGPEPPPNLTALQADLDEARYQHNEVLPSQAGDCDGRPPFQAHPEVLQPLRPYHSSVELELFSLDRVDRFLARFSWQHKVTQSGQVSLHGHLYYVGTVHGGKTVDVRFDPADRHFVFTDAKTGEELKRRPTHGLDTATITGLEVPTPPPEGPIQLSFPW
jgi:transposase InsO family protein